MFAREGYPFILGAAAIAAFAFVMAIQVRLWPLWLMALLLTVIALGVAWFFRTPARDGERGAAVAVNAAYGTISLRTNIDETRFERPTVRRSGLMNMFDVHVNRQPVALLQPT